MSESGSRQSSTDEQRASHTVEMAPSSTDFAPNRAMAASKSPPYAGVTPPSHGGGTGSNPVLAFLGRTAKRIWLSEAVSCVASAV